jgi:hypothetical protein
MGQWRLSRVNNSKGANTEYGAAEEKGLPHEEQQQRPANKRVMHPSCKDVAKAQCCWGRDSKLPERGSTPTAELGVPLNLHGFVTNWGLGMVVGVIYYFILA